ncbi:RNA-directed DNA polymerase, eukaryota [Tanacetum coccineum]
MMSQTTLPKSFWDYALETATRILNMVPTKKNRLITQEASGSLEDLKIIQEEDTHPSIDTSLYLEKDDLEIDEPQSDINPIRRSIKTRHPTDRLCLYIDAEEHELRDLSKPANYKAALLDPNKRLFKKKTDMDGAVHTYKACLVAKGYTQTSGIDYEETFSLVAYIKAIRILIAIAACTRPDVAFAQNITSRFQKNPGELHWTAVKNIIKYLRNTKDMFLVYGGDIKLELSVSCYTDAGYLTDVDNLKSQTGYVFVLNGGVVDWKSTKQSIFATSSAKAKYIAASDTFKEAMYCDNTGAITIANKSGITKGARHYRAKVHYLREVIEFGDVKIEKVHTDDNLADPFTKALPFPKLSEHTKNIESATPTPKWELLEYGSWIRLLCN